MTKNVKRTSFAVVVTHVYPDVMSPCDSVFSCDWHVVSAPSLTGASRLCLCLNLCPSSSSVSVYALFMRENGLNVHHMTVPSTADAAFFALTLLGSRITQDMLLLDVGC